VDRLAKSVRRQRTEKERGLLATQQARTEAAEAAPVPAPTGAGPAFLCNHICWGNV